MGFGSAAYQTLSSLLPSETPCEQVNDAGFIKQSAVKIPYKTDEGKIYIPPTPGLGVDPDYDALAGLTKKEISFP